MSTLPSMLPFTALVGRPRQEYGATRASQACMRSHLPLAGALLAGLALAGRGLKPGGSVAGGSVPDGPMPDGAGFEDDAAAPGLRSARPTALGVLLAAGVPIDRLRRSLEDGPDEWTWEQDPVGSRMVREAEEGALARLSGRTRAGRQPRP